MDEPPFLRGKPHPEAGELLDLLGQPDLLEGTSLPDLERSLQLAGYRPREPSNDMGVTVGWGRVVDRNETSTCATFLRDGKVYRLSLGSRGDYRLYTLVNDISHPTREDIARITGELWIDRGNCGTQFMAWWERQEKPAIPETRRLTLKELSAILREFHEKGDLRASASATVPILLTARSTI